jgi:Ca2+-binding RTX toxin-like protein
LGGSVSEAGDAPGVRLLRLVRVLIAPALAAVLFSSSTSQADAADPVIAAAGDIACEPGSSVTDTKCRERYTSDLLVNAGLAAVLPLGDLQYNSASLSNLSNSYDVSWGRVKSITRPSLGNHESSGSGYFDYFNGVGVNNGPAGERGNGYYSFDVGAWHLIALNSNCSRVSCSAGSAQERWLRADLASHPNGCTLAYWHHPRFSSGHDGDNSFTAPLWDALYEAQADVVLVGHSHDYERFAPQDSTGRKDTVRGIREFVVGTGGAFFTGISSARPNSEVRQNSTFGVLFLTLRPTSYEWSFVPEAGRSFTDSGVGSCHGPNTTPPPPTPTALPGGFPPGGSPAAGDSPPLPADVVSLADGAPHQGSGGVGCTIVGTEGRDVLRGTDAADVICGLGGRDVVRGRDGDDVIVGGAGKDRLRGGRGNDRLYGNARRDVLRGQSGDDRIVGGRGPDHIYGNVGNDHLRSRDRRGGDRVFGGRGFDGAWVNRGDRVRRSERISVFR